MFYPQYVSSVRISQNLTGRLTQKKTIPEVAKYKANKAEVPDQNFLQHLKQDMECAAQYRASGRLTDMRRFCRDVKKPRKLFIKTK